MEVIIGSKKTTTNSPGWSAPPATAATTALQNDVNQGVDFSTPIRASYARSAQQLQNSYNNPLGAYTTADVQGKTMNAQTQAMNQSEGLDLANAAQENAQGTFNRQATVAGLTAPQMYNASSTTSTPFGLGQAIGLGANIGSSILTKGASGG